MTISCHPSHSEGLALCPGAAIEEQGGKLSLEADARPLVSRESHSSPDLSSWSPEASLYAAFFRQQHPRVAAAGNYMKSQVFLPSNECFALQCPTRLQLQERTVIPGADGRWQE